MYMLNIPFSACMLVVITNDKIGQFYQSAKLEPSSAAEFIADFISRVSYKNQPTFCRVILSANFLVRLSVYFFPCGIYYSHD